MKLKSNIPSVKNFFGIILVLFISVLVVGKVKNQSEVLYLSLWLGISFGIVLQRSRFCFYCLSRDFIEKRNAKGLLGIITSLVVGTLGYHVGFGAFLIGGDDGTRSAPATFGVTARDSFYKNSP